jgi:predicted amidohydrolase YtcJ
VSASRETADRVFVHGGVYTVDPAQPWVEAVVQMTLFDGDVVYRAE